MSKEAEYIDFMYDKANSMNCAVCPENRSFDSWGGNLPCGQQNCWVDCHCAGNAEDEDGNFVEGSDFDW